MGTRHNLLTQGRIYGNKQLNNTFNKQFINLIIINLSKYDGQ